VGISGIFGAPMGPENALPFVVELVLCAFYQIESFRVLPGIPQKHIIYNIIYNIIYYIYIIYIYYIII
jgi:hypothetical protein